MMREDIDSHCVKSVQTRSFSGTYFPVFGLNTDQKNSAFGHISHSFQLFNIYLQKESSFFKLDILKESFKCNLKEEPNVFFDRYKGMIFHSWKQLSYSLFTHEIWRLVNLFRIATIFRTPYLKFLKILLCFILELVLFYKKKVWIVNNVT